MAAAATQIYSSRPEEQDEEYASVLAARRHPLRTHSMLTASSREESKRLNDERGTRIIISASGMMTGGRVMHHALRILPDPQATVVFVGYQAAGTTGRRIVDGERKVRIMKEEIRGAAALSVSAALRTRRLEGVLRWVEPLEKSPPRRVFTTHANRRPPPRCATTSSSATAGALTPRSTATE